MSRVLDKSRDFGTVTAYGDANIHHVYEQDGRCFDGRGIEIDCKTGKRLGPEPNNEQSPVPDVPEKSDNGYAGLSWDQEAEEPEDAPRIVTLDWDGELIPVPIDEAAYETVGDIRDMIDKLGGEYHPNHRRKTLWKRLIARVYAIDEGIWPGAPELSALDIVRNSEEGEP